MKPYEIKNLIIDNFEGQESVTADFTYNDKEYSITFNKADFEVINMWFFDKDTSIPAKLSNQLIELIREDVKKRISKTEGVPLK